MEVPLYICSRLIDRKETLFTPQKAFMCTHSFMILIAKIKNTSIQNLCEGDPKETLLGFELLSIEGSEETLND